MDRNVNEFEAVGRLVATSLIRGGTYRYVMYVQSKRIEFFAAFDLPNDIKPMDYIYVKGYVNGRTRTNEESGEAYHTQNLRATSIDRATSELYNRFGVDGNVADTFFNVYLAGIVDEIEFDGDNSARFLIRVKPAPEHHSRRERTVSVVLSKSRFPDSELEVGDAVCMYLSLNISDYENGDGQKRSRQRLNVEEYALISEEA